MPAPSKNTFLLQLSNKDISDRLAMFSPNETVKNIVNYTTAII